MTITVWLGPEAKSGWQAAINDATKKVRAKHPAHGDQRRGARRTEHSAKLETSLAGGNLDVVEINSEMLAYMAAGASAAEEGGLSQLEDLAEGLDRLR